MEDGVCPLILGSSTRTGVHGGIRMARGRWGLGSRATLILLLRLGQPGGGGDTLPPGMVVPLSHPPPLPILWLLFLVPPGSGTDRVGIVGR